MLAKSQAGICLEEVLGSLFGYTFRRLKFVVEATAAHFEWVSATTIGSAVGLAKAALIKGGFVAAVEWRTGYALSIP